MVVLGLLLVLVVGGVALGLRYAGVPDDVRQVRAVASGLADQARAITPETLDQQALDGLAEDFHALRDAMEPLRSIVADDPFVGVARALPVVGDQVRAADDLVAASDALLEAGDIGLPLAGEVVTLRAANEADPDYQLMPGLVELMATSTADVDRLAELVAEAEARLAAIPDSALGQILEARDLVLEPLSTYAPLLESFAEHNDALPGLFGWGGEKRYLVLAQNPAELRPSGGYLGTVGIIALKDGAVTEQRFQDIYELDTQEGLPFVEPPPELAAYLLGEEQSWRLADAAWSPDFPTSAAKALEFYELESGEEGIDGVIAITTFALDRLLEVTGPVRVPRYDVTVAPGDVTLTLLGVTRGTEQRLEGRKDVLGALALQMTQRLLTLPPSDWIATAEALDDIGREQLALAWFAEPEAQRLLEDLDWDGAVRQDPGDYLYVVESNVVPTSKYNLVVDRADSLVVKLDEQGDAVNSLRLDWDNRAGLPGEPFASLRSFSNNEEGLYGAYVRTLVPEGSELVTASGEADTEIRGVERVGEEAGRATFANRLLMLPGDSTLTYLWTAPSVAEGTEDGWVYQLTVQKQPGARAHPFTVRIDLPDGAVVEDLSEGLEVDANRVHGAFVLDRDLELRVDYRLP